MRRYDPVVLEAVRLRLAAGGPAAGLARLVEACGPAAAAAEPELLAALPHAPRAVAVALAATEVPAPAAVPAQRAAARDGDVRCGVAVWRTTGDPAAVLAAVERQLATGGVELWWHLRRAAPAGAALGPLVPALREPLTGRAADTYPQRAVQAAAARLVWLATGDRAAVLPTLAAVLATGGNPARAAAELAEPLREQALAPVLRDLLADPAAAVPAARALWRLGTPVADLAPALVTAVGGGETDAVPLLVELAAVDAVDDLTRLAERDERIVVPGVVDEDVVWFDEWLQRDLRAAVAALRMA
jgi:hypothetical protein